jgi:hypothetical protein
MQRMVQAPARIAISPAARLFVSTTTSAGISQEHVTIWQSSRNTVGWRQAGVVAPAENKRVLQYPKLILLVFQRYSKAGACPIRVHVWTASWQELSDVLQHWSGAVTCPACYCAGVAAGPNALRGSGPKQKRAL